MEASLTRKRPRTLVGAHEIAPLTLPPSENDRFLRASDTAAERGRLAFHWLTLPRGAHPAAADHHIGLRWPDRAGATQAWPWQVARCSCRVRGPSRCQSRRASRGPFVDWRCAEPWRRPQAHNKRSSCWTGFCRQESPCLVGQVGREGGWAAARVIGGVDAQHVSTRWLARGEAPRRGHTSAPTISFRPVPPKQVARGASKGGRNTCVQGKKAPKPPKIFFAGANRPNVSSRAR